MTNQKLIEYNKDQLQSCFETRESVIMSRKIIPTKEEDQIVFLRVEFNSGLKQANDRIKKIIYHKDLITFELVNRWDIPYYLIFSNRRG